MQNHSDFTIDKIEDKIKVPAAVGIHNGLKLTIDLHSNSESFGSVTQDFAAFKVFIGQPTEFPALEESSILIQPGHQHYLLFSSQVYTASGIERLNPQGQRMFFLL